MLNDLDSLPPESLRDLAAYLRKLADQISNHADLIASSAKRERQAKTQRSEIRAAVLAAAQKVIALIDGGIQTDDAYAQVMAETAYAKEGLQAAVAMVRRKHREERDIVIAWLSQAGVQNTAIAKIVNLHPVNVSKLKSKSHKYQRR
ncbi:hypothetical protein [Telmatospirillum siberiense]|nr:hypothetical protein [Telmatospirillum siberiense]